MKARNGFDTPLLKNFSGALEAQESLQEPPLSPQMPPSLLPVSHGRTRFALLPCSLCFCSIVAILSVRGLVEVEVLVVDEVLLLL